jgi:single-strand DNA-binding protein
MNLVVLVGNLTRDPEVRYTQSGLAVANIFVAVNRVSSKEGGPDADFFRVTLFGKQAELAERYLSKGRKVGVEGRLQNDNYEKEGQTVYRDTIIANRLEFLSPKGDGDQFGGGFGGQPDDAFGRSAPPASYSGASQPGPARPPAEPGQAGPGQAGQGQGQYAGQAAQPPAGGAPAAQPEPVPGGFSALEDDEDDLPF